MRATLLKPPRISPACRAAISIFVTPPPSLGTSGFPRILSEAGGKRTRDSSRRWNGSSIPDQGSSELVVASWDRHLLLARIAGALAANNINIHPGADLFQRSDDVVPTFSACAPPTSRRSPTTAPRLACARSSSRRSKATNFDFSEAVKAQPRALKGDRKRRRRGSAAHQSQQRDQRGIYRARTPGARPHRPALRRLHGHRPAWPQRFCHARINTEKGVAIDAIYLQDTAGKKITHRNPLAVAGDSWSARCSSNPPTFGNMTMENDGPVILFDGVCNFCAWSVPLCHRAGSARRVPLCVAFNPKQAGVSCVSMVLEDVAMDSLVLVEGGVAWRESDAALRVCLPHPGWLFPTFFGSFSSPTLSRTFGWGTLFAQGAFLFISSWGPSPPPAPCIARPRAFSPPAHPPFSRGSPTHPAEGTSPQDHGNLRGPRRAARRHAADAAAGCAEDIQDARRLRDRSHGQRAGRGAAALHELGLARAPVGDAIHPVSVSRGPEDRELRPASARAVRQGAGAAAEGREGRGQDRGVRGHRRRRRRSTSTRRSSRG